MGGEVLQDGRASGVADEFPRPPTVSFSLRSPDTFADYLSETASPQVEISPEGRSWLSGERSPNGHCATVIVPSDDPVPGFLNPDTLIAPLGRNRHG
ncbi:hypothetical protein GCM10023334_097990 [Nonomuraea thailandensis]